MYCAYLLIDKVLLNGHLLRDVGDTHRTYMNAIIQVSCVIILYGEVPMGLDCYNYVYMYNV